MDAASANRDGFSPETHKLLPATFRWLATEQPVCLHLHFTIFFLQLQVHLVAVKALSSEF